MANGFFQKVDLTGRIQNSNTGFGGISPMKTNSLEETQTTSFKDMMGGLAQNLNAQMNAPDQLLKGAMTGDNDVDIHDVMTAMAKAEISVNVATQITSKVIQAYDKIMQISV